MAITMNERLMTAIFLRKGGEGHRTRLFDNLAAREQSTLLRAAQLEPGETAVVGHVADHSEWCMITTRRLIWKNKDGSGSVELAGIRRIVHDMVADIQNGRWDKNQWQDLRIEDETGQVATLMLEEGRPFFAVWNLLHRAKLRLARDGADTPRLKQSA